MIYVIYSSGFVGLGVAFFGGIYVIIMKAKIISEENKYEKTSSDEVGSFRFILIFSGIFFGIIFGLVIILLLIFTWVEVLMGIGLLLLMGVSCVLIGSGLPFFGIFLGILINVVFYTFITYRSIKYTKKLKLIKNGETPEERGKNSDLNSHFK